MPPRFPPDHPPVFLSLSLSVKPSSAEHAKDGKSLWKREQFSGGIIHFRIMSKEKPGPVGLFVGWLKGTAFCTFVVVDTRTGEWEMKIQGRGIGKAMDNGREGPRRTKDVKMGLQLILHFFLYSYSSSAISGQ